MRRIPFITGGALGLCIAAGPCLAGTMDLQFNGSGKYLGSVAYYDGSAVFSGQTLAVGQLMYTISDVNDASGLFDHLEGQTVALFCTDLFDAAASGNDMTIYDLEDAPVPGTSMGQDRAELIGALYWAHYADSDDSNTNAAGFQAAIWEIAYEGDFDSGAASFAASGLDASVAGMDDGFRVANSTIYNQANSWLEDAWDAWQNGDYWNLFAAAGDGFQDVIIVPIPLPVPLALAGVGLLGIFAGRRRLIRLVH